MVIVVKRQFIHCLTIACCLEYCELFTGRQRKGKHRVPKRWEVAFR